MTSSLGQTSPITNTECQYCLLPINEIKNPVLPVRASGKISVLKKIKNFFLPDDDLHITAEKCSHICCKICFEDWVKTYNKNLSYYEAKLKRDPNNTHSTKPVLICGLCNVEVNSKYIELSSKDMAKLGIKMETDQSIFSKIGEIFAAIIAKLRAILSAVF